MNDKPIDLKYLYHDVNGKDSMLEGLSKKDMHLDKLTDINERSWYKTYYFF